MNQDGANGLKSNWFGGWKPRRADRFWLSRSVELPPKDLGSLPREKAISYYDDLTSNSSASHHLQVKAGIACLYKILDKKSPFIDCLAPRFRPEALEIHFLEAGDIGKVLLHMRNELGTDYFGRLASHLAEALFFTACRFHEWALLSTDLLVRNGAGEFTTARLKVKGGKHRDVPLMPRLGDFTSRVGAIFGRPQRRAPTTRLRGICWQRFGFPRPGRNSH